MGSPARESARLGVRLLLAGCVLVSVAMAAARSAPAAEVPRADSIFLLDFETGLAADWTPRPADRPYFRALEYRSDQALRGSRSLYCEVRGYEEGVPRGNEQSLITYRLPRPVRMDSSTVVSWTWWIRDKETNDGVVLSIYATDSTGQSSLYLPWMSHSNHQRGRWPFDDPAGRPVTHSQRVVEDTRLGASDPWPPPPWYLIRIEIGFAFPTDQVFFLDDLRVGPSTGAPSATALRTESRSVVPEPTFLRLADLDGDGRLDRLIGQEGTSPTLYLALPRGGHRMLEPAQTGLENARSLLDATFADLDQDGRLDLIGLDRQGLLLFRGLGGGEFRPMPPIRPHDLIPPAEAESLTFHQVHPKVPFGVIAADLLPRPGPELLLLRTVAQQMDSIYSWVGPWRWKAEPLPASCLGPPVPPLPKAGRYRHGAAVGDIDGDLDLDLVQANTDLMLQTRNGLACASAERLPGYGMMQGIPALSDIDADGDLDLFLPVDLRHTANDVGGNKEKSLLWRNDGGIFHDVSEDLQAFDTRHAHNPAFEDFDLDGDLDLFFLQSAWSRKLPLRPPNIYLENDGAGRLSEEAGLDSWLMETPPAHAAVTFDADADGDPDVLLLPRDGGPPRLCRNLAEGRPAIQVRLLDRRGVPHAAGASIALHESGAGGERGRLVAYRQSGVGSVLPGCGEALLGCAADKVYQLVVTWPSAPSRPMVRSALRPGARITLIEPAFPGPVGALYSQADVRRRRLVDRLALTGWPLLVPLAMVYAMGAGVAGFAFRRVLPRWNGESLQEGGWRSPRSRRAAFLLLAAAGALFVLVAQPVWPGHRTAQVGAPLAMAGLGFGLIVGVAAAWLDSKRREALRSQTVGAAEARATLLAAIDGFSHATWLRYLGGIAALSRSLIEGVEPEAIHARLRSRVDAYGTTIGPQMQEILQVLPKAGLDPEVVRNFREDHATIEHSVESVRHVLEAGGPEETVPPSLPPGACARFQTDLPAGTLERLADASGRMHETVQQIFRELGRGLRTDVAVAVAAAIDRVRESHPHLALQFEAPGSLPGVFAAPGDLANILDNLLANAARAAAAHAAERPAAVEELARRSGGLVTIAVRDSGAGIPASKQAGLFDARITDPDRHGRGLPYARRRLHQLDGDISLHSSSAEEGTEFVVTLRTVAEASDAAAR